MASIYLLYLNIAFVTLGIVIGSCTTGQDTTYYQLQFYTLGAPSSTHSDVPISQCVQSCDFGATGGLFKHGSDTRLCECYNLPHTLTNVVTGTPVWIAGKLLTFLLLYEQAHVDTLLNKC